MGHTYTNFAAATVGDADRYVTTVDMKVGAYVLAQTAPSTGGARHVTCTRTFGDTADTAGTVVVVGKDLSGQTITETLTPGANAILVTGTKWFAKITSVTGVGWVIDGAEGTKDTIVVGQDDQQVVATSGGHLQAVIINTTAAGSITLVDSKGTIAVLPANATVGHYIYDLDFSGYLRVELAAASNITVVHSSSLPQTYAMS